MMAMDLAKLDALAPSFLEVDWRRFEQTGPREWRVTIAVGEYRVVCTFGFDEAGKLVRDDIETI